MRNTKAASGARQHQLTSASRTAREMHERAGLLVRKCQLPACSDVSIHHRWTSPSSQSLAFTNLRSAAHPLGRACVVGSTARPSAAPPDDRSVSLTQTCSLSVCEATNSKCVPPQAPFLLDRVGACSPKSSRVFTHSVCIVSSIPMSIVYKSVSLSCFSCVVLPT